MSRRFIALGIPVAVSAALALAGCGTNSPPAPPAVEHKEGDGHAHAHPAHGPHDGHLIELGEEEYHAELTHDDATKSVTVYLLDKETKRVEILALRAGADNALSLVALGSTPIPTEGDREIRDASAIGIAPGGSALLVGRSASRFLSLQ